MTDPIKQLTLTPAFTALVKDVFGPSAKLLGTELKSYLKEKFDDARERRRSQNLSKHFEAVRTSMQKPPSCEIPYEQIDIFSEWVEGAQDVSDDDPELAHMWRELLREIVQGQPITKSLLAVMKQVDSRMAGILLRFRQRHKTRDAEMLLFLKTLSFFGLRGVRRFRGENLFHAKRLESLGLLDRDYSHIVNSIFFVLAFAVATYYGFEYLTLHQFTEPMNGFEKWATGVNGKFEIISSFVIVLIVNIRSAISRTAFRLTWTAEQLLTYAKRSAAEADSVGCGEEQAAPSA